MQIDLRTVAASLEVTLPKPLSKQDLLSTVAALLGGRVASA